MATGGLLPKWVNPNDSDVSRPTSNQKIQFPLQLVGLSYLEWLNCLCSSYGAYKRIFLVSFN